MKRAAFRLQPVLELRRTEERAAAAAAAQAANTAADADRRATERTRPRWPRRSCRRRCSRASSSLAMTLLRTAATDASDARSLATAQAEQAELVRAQWTAAAQRTKGLEQLSERHQDALQHAEDAAEERAVDDLVTGRAGATADAEAQEEVPWTE